MAPPEFTPDGRREVVSLVADNALAAFILTQVALKRSARLARYMQRDLGNEDFVVSLQCCRRSRLTSRCLYNRYCRRDDLNRRMPGFKVALGYGLHVGWAIEGAIGEDSDGRPGTVARTQNLLTLHFS